MKPEEKARQQIDRLLEGGEPELDPELEEHSLFDLPE